MSLIDDITPRTAARVAGIGYVALFVLAIFANFFVREGMVDQSDAALTVANITGSEGLFRTGIAAFVLVFLIDVPVAWALYILFKPAGPTRSLLAAWFRLVYTVFLGVAAVFMFLGLHIATGAVGTVSMGSDASLLMFEAFNYAWLVGLMAFGVHLALIGRMMLTSSFAPRWLGWILTAAGMAYVADTLANTLLTDYASVSGVMLAVVAVPSIIAEASFTWWLLARAGRIENHSAVEELAAV